MAIGKGPDSRENGDTNLRDRRAFFVTFLALGALIAGAVLMVYVAEYREFEARVAFEESADLMVQEELILRRIDDVVTDLLFLTHTQCLIDGLLSGDFRRTDDTFLIFAEAKKRYAQLRFLDVNGMEVVRIDTDDEGSHLIRPENLQDKSDRYYFQDAIGLADGQVFVSPLDLNIENGQIEFPLKPMIRFASPVFLDGELKGLIVLNYAAGGLLDELREVGARNMGDFYLLNRDGYYLLSSSPRDEWGFMYPDGQERRFSYDHSDSWDSVAQDSESFQMEVHGLLVHRRIYPMKKLGLNTPDYYWIAVNLVEEDELHEGAASLRGRLFILGGFLFLLSALPSWAISALVARTARQRRQLLAAANYDELTGLPNRHLAMDRINQAVSLSRRHKWPGVLYFLDLDGFKEVNDRHGHETGDLLLAEIGRRLASSIRESDTAARYGGDEFLVLVPREDKDPADLAARLIGIVSKPVLLPGLEATVSVSIGIRRFSGTEGENAEDLIRDADAAMYEAKAEGKGVYSFWSG